jgi:hypothetical protein
MKKTRNIHNLDSLEKEIHRLKLDARNTEEKLDGNVEHFRKNFFSLFVNSLFCKKPASENGKESFFESALKNDKLGLFFSKITDRVADRAVAGLESLVEKTFRKKK